MGDRTDHYLTVPFETAPSEEVAEALITALTGWPTGADEVTYDEEAQEWECTSYELAMGLEDHVNEVKKALDELGLPPHFTLMEGSYGPWSARIHEETPEGVIEAHDCDEGGELIFTQSALLNVLREAPDAEEAVKELLNLIDPLGKARKAA